ASCGLQYNGRNYDRGAQTGRPTRLVKGETMAIRIESVGRGQVVALAPLFHAPLAAKLRQAPGHFSRISFFLAECGGSNRKTKQKKQSGRAKHCRTPYCICVVRG